MSLSLAFTHNLAQFGCSVSLRFCPLFRSESFKDDDAIPPLILKAKGLCNLQVRQKPKVPTAAVCSEHVELRRELLTLIQLQKQVRYHPANCLLVTSICNFYLVLEHHC